MESIFLLDFFPPPLSVTNTHTHTQTHIHISVTLGNL